MSAHHDHVMAPFGHDRFGQLAERFARFFGTPGFIIGQTMIVIAWIAWNVTGGVAWLHVGRFDRAPFIALNLLFSVQAAYAAPLILLAQTRQADRDKHSDDRHERHREEIAAEQNRLLSDIHKQVCP